jgi:hypothetical protein
MEEYSLIKREYSFLSLRAWIIATQHYNNCKQDLIPILYFYSAKCDSCIKQGEYIDKLKEKLSPKELIAFTIDLELNESSVDLIKTYYNITQAPAMIIHNTVLQGRTYNEKEIETFIK